MIGRTTLIAEPHARGALRLAMFAALLLLTALIGHRVQWMTTPLAVNVAGAAYLVAAAGLAFGLYAAASIWIRGRTGAWPTAWALAISGLLWAWPALYAPAFLNLPRISDVTTSPQNPPAYSMLARQRPAGANSVTYNAARNAAEQLRAYPDLQTLVIPRSAEEIYEVTLDLMRGRRGLGWKVVAEEAPRPQLQRAGFIEVTERTLILGFTDDIVVRIAGNEIETRLDVRSSSRYGNHDFGTNAARIRRFVRELATKLDATGQVASRGGVRIQQAGSAPSNAVAGPGSNIRRPIERSQEKAAKR